MGLKDILDMSIRDIAKETGEFIGGCVVLGLMTATLSVPVLPIIGYIVAYEKYNPRPRQHQHVYNHSENHNSGTIEPNYHHEKADSIIEEEIKK